MKIDLSGKLFRNALLLILFGCIQTTFPQLHNSSNWEKKFAHDYTFIGDIPYKRIGTDSVLLDIYVPKDHSKPHPTLMFYHGGGWVKGSKDEVNGQLVPYLNRGWVVVNVEYRFLQKAMMPAPVEDVRCALNWVYEHALLYAIDTAKIVQSGTSAGGHLALISGVLPPHSSLDGACRNAHDLKTAAIVDFYGIADLNALLALPARKNQVKKFFPNLNEAEKIGALVSPMQYLTKQTPPVFIVHGNEDPTVPFSQALCLKSMLDSLGVYSVLHTVQGGGHGKFSREEMTIIYREISDFLKKEIGESLRLDLE